MDLQCWARLSPLIDELLEIDAGQREERLAKLRGTDEALVLRPRDFET